MKTKSRPSSWGPMTVRTVPTGPIRPKSAAPGPSWANTCASGLVVRTSFGSAPEGVAGLADVVATGVTVRIGVGVASGAGGPSTATVSVRLTQP